MEFWSLSDSRFKDRALPFQEVSDLQKILVERRARDEIPDTFLFLEHQSVVTRGRGLQFTGSSRERAMPLPPLPAGTEYFETERGGDLTWHGPGQLVLYPIVKLNGEGFSESHDVTGFLRRLERATVALHSQLGLQAQARENATGVWVGDRKTASAGIAIRKWVTYHGIALNVVNPLAPFQIFSPCGFSSEVMTNLASLLGPDRFKISEWRSEIEGLWAKSLLAASLNPQAFAGIQPMELSESVRPT